MENFLQNARFFDEPVSVLSTYDSFGPTTGSLLTEGGLGVKQSVHVGEHLTVNSVDMTPSLGDIILERESVLTSEVLSPATVSEFFFYNDITQSFKAVVSVHVENLLNSDLNKNSVYTLHGTLKPSGWTLNSSFTGDVTGVKFSINNTSISGRSAGSILYINPNSSDTTTTIRFKANTISPTGATNDSGPYGSIATTVDATTIDYTPSSNADWGNLLPNSVQGSIDVLADRVSNITFANEYHVGKAGNNTYGNGSHAMPYLTIQAAVNAAESSGIPNSQTINIYVHPGDYGENVTISKPNIAIIGFGMGASNNCRLSGKITINANTSSGGPYNTIYSIQNLLITGSTTDAVINHTGTQGSYLFLSNCKLYTARVGQKLLSFTNTGDVKVRITKCEFVASTLAVNAECIYTAPGCRITGYLTDSNIYGNSATALVLNAASTLTVLNTTIDSTSDYIVSIADTTGILLMNCLLTNSKLNSNGILLAGYAQLGLTYTTINVPTTSSYNPLNPDSTPPPTLTTYAVEGTSTNVVAYSNVSFIPLLNLSGTYYWTTNKISSDITNKFQYNSNFV